MKRVLAEALAIAAVGALLAFAANWAALVLTHGASGIVLRAGLFPRQLDKPHWTRCIPSGHESIAPTNPRGAVAAGGASSC